MNKMLEELADDLQAIIDDERPRLNKTEMHGYVDALRTHHATITDMAKRLEAAERDARRWRFLCENFGSSYGDGYTEPRENSLVLEWQQGPWVYDGSNGGRGYADCFPGWSAIVDELMRAHEADMEETGEPCHADVLLEIANRRTPERPE